VQTFIETMRGSGAADAGDADTPHHITNTAMHQTMPVILRRPRSGRLEGW
jgi:hypothetical protein